MSSKKIGYWWLNASPSIWEFESKAVGGREWYSSRNEKGNKRRIFEWFYEVKPNDIVLGYVTSPTRKIVAVCKITRGIYPTNRGDRIEFEKIEHLANPIPYEVLQRVPELAACEPLLYRQGSLFKLSPQEYEMICSLEPPDPALITDLRQSTNGSRSNKTVVQVLQYARIGQGRYGSDVRRIWGSRCSVTGISTAAVLESSHIKCWSDSNNAERLDPHNGLLLTANLHRLFDAGLISFQNSGGMLISPRLSKDDRRNFGLYGQRLSKKPSAKMTRYLSHHRKNTFR